MAELSLKNKTVNSVGWKFAGSLTSYSITFIVGVVLARLLSPDQYGLIGIIMIFITVFNGMVDSGFSNALIRKTDSCDIDYSTCFITNLVFSIALYVVLFIGAPYISLFFKREELTALCRVMGLLLLFQALSQIQQTLLTKELNFKVQAKCTVTASIISGVVGITMAFSGMGVWALVGQQLSRQLTYAISLWVVRSWWPKLLFSWESFKDLWGFGWKILLSGVLSNVWIQMSQFVIGKFYSPQALGYYTKGQDYVNLVSQNLTLVVQSVSYPALSQMQDDKQRLKAGYKRVIKVTMLVTFVLVIGLAASAKPFIVVLIGEKWLPSVPMMQLVCFSSMLFPLHAINLNMLQVQGRSDLYLKLEIIKKFVFVAPILLGIFFSIYWMLFANIICGIISYYLNAYYSGPFLGYSIKEQISDVLPSFMVAIIMGVIVYGISFLPVSYYVLLPVQVLIGACLVIGLCKTFKLEEYTDCKEMLKVYLGKIKHTKNNGDN